MPSFHRRFRRLLAGLAGLALAGAGLAATTAPASANRWDDDTVMFTADGTMMSPSHCTSDALPHPQHRKHLVPGAPASTISATYGVRSTGDDDPSDRHTVTASVTAKARLLGSLSAPTGLTLSYHGTASVITASGKTSVCLQEAEASAVMITTFTVTSRTRLTVYADAYGAAVSNVIISRPQHGTTELHLGSTPASQRSSSILEPGTYSVDVGGATWIRGASPRSVTGSGTIAISFGRTGLRAEKAGTSKYVTMPKARKCAKHAVSPKVTTVAARVRKVKRIAFRVNGHTVRTVKHPHRGARIKLKAPDGRPLTLEARVKLTNGRTITSTASYQPCS